MASHCIPTGKVQANVRPCLKGGGQCSRGQHPRLLSSCHTQNNTHICTKIFVVTLLAYHTQTFQFLSPHWLSISRLYQCICHHYCCSHTFMPVIAHSANIRRKKKTQQLSSTPLKIYIYRNNSPFSGTLRKKGPFWGSKTNSGDECSTVPQITNPQVFRPGLGQC